MPKKLPKSFQEYFWDTDFDKINLSSNTKYVIKRILDRGNLDSIKWILNNFPIDIIKHTLISSKDISRKTANFWAEYFNIPKSQITCLQKPYSPIHFGLSS